MGTILLRVRQRTGWASTYDIVQFGRIYQIGLSPRLALVFKKGAVRPYAFTHVDTQPLIPRDAVFFSIKFKNRISRHVYFQFIGRSFPRYWKSCVQILLPSSSCWKVSYSC